MQAFKLLNGHLRLFGELSLHGRALSKINEIRGVSDTECLRRTDYERNLFPHNRVVYIIKSLRDGERACESRSADAAGLPLPPDAINHVTTCSKGEPNANDASPPLPECTYCGLHLQRSAFCAAPRLCAMRREIESADVAASFDLDIKCASRRALFRCRFAAVKLSRRVAKYFNRSGVAIAHTRECPIYANPVFIATRTPRTF